jgi:hypothetical protein
MEQNQVQWEPKENQDFWRFEFNVIDSMFQMCKSIHILFNSLKKLEYYTVKHILNLSTDMRNLFG